MLTISIIATITFAMARASDYGDLIARLPVDMSARLAEANAPIESGAIGRNKKAYFHVRFQRGMHHIADYGLVTKRVDVIDRFLDAAEYSFRSQLPSGDFKLVIPTQLQNQGDPSLADRASGVAFFASSLGMGFHALETNDWFQSSLACENHRQRLATLKPKLSLTLDYLVKQKTHLEEADREAPNRLLFDAVAFMTLGKLLKNDDALKIGSSFVAKAVKLVDLEEGYFIEGSGYDSSYNGVATALAIRLLMLGYRDHNLERICADAIRWQQGRILATGEISTQGNTRVRPGDLGESFLGREKDVDVGHTVEALMLASQFFSDRTSMVLASRVVKHYEEENRDRR